MKVVFWIVGCLIALAVAVIPEVAMYFLYGLINPQSEVTRVITLLAFFVFGGSACVGFGAIGIAIFASVTGAVLKDV